MEPTFNIIILHVRGVKISVFVIVCVFIFSSNICKAIITIHEHYFLDMVKIYLRKLGHRWTSVNLQRHNDKEAFFVKFCSQITDLIQRHLYLPYEDFGVQLLPATTSTLPSPKIKEEKAEFHVTLYRERGLDSKWSRKMDGSNKSSNSRGGSAVEVPYLRDEVKGDKFQRGVGARTGAHGEGLA